MSSGIRHHQAGNVREHHQLLGASSLFLVNLVQGKPTFSNTLQIPLVKSCVGSWEGSPTLSRSVLVGNKLDLSEERAVSTVEGQVSYFVVLQF